MKGTVTLENGQVIEIEINEEQLKQIQVKKKTGYERVKEGDIYYYAKNHDGHIDYFNEAGDNFDNKIYNTANYYSDETVAKNNARADTLLRKLRRFAVEHRTEELDWNREVNKCGIFYEHDHNRLWVHYGVHWQGFGGIYFDTETAARKAIEKFHDELIWYFTEYKDSL